MLRTPFFLIYSFISYKQLQPREPLNIGRDHRVKYFLFTKAILYQKLIVYPVCYLSLTVLYDDKLNSNYGSHFVKDKCSASSRRHEIKAVVVFRPFKLFRFLYDL